MYFNGSLSVDPSQITKIEKKKPDSTFGKLINILSKGKHSLEVEQETFSALTVLQQFNTVFYSLGISNVVRLSQDDLFFYLDESGADNDLQRAIDQFDVEMDHRISDHFNTLDLVLEHDQGSFHLLIDIQINRTHAVGAYPIQINVSGVLNEFKAKRGETTDELALRMQKVFATQGSYRMFVEQRQKEFVHFLEQLSLSIKKFIPIDDLVFDFSTKMVVPERKLDRTDTISKHPHSKDPVMFGYAGMAGLLAYTMLWTDMAHARSIRVSDTELVAENGDLLGEIGGQPVDASSLDLLDPDLDYDERLEGFHDSYPEWEDAAPETDDDDDDSWWDYGGSDPYGFN